MVCTCVNGGRCLNDDAYFQICECPSDFTGDRCQDLVFDFAHKDIESDLDKIAIGLGVFFLLFIALLVCYLIWRKLWSFRKRKLDELLNQNRRQSKATIEGVTVNGYDTGYPEALTNMERATQLSFVNEKALSEKIVSETNSNAKGAELALNRSNNDVHLKEKS